MNTLLASSLTTASLQSNDQSLSWTPEAMVQMKTISDVQISPNNKSVLFVASEPMMSEEKGTLLARIYKADRQGNALPFSNADASSMQPRWSPDGQRIAFISVRSGARNLYLISAEGGEATALTKSKKDVQTFSWSPDGKKIAFVMSDETAAEKERIKLSLTTVYNEKTTVNRLYVIDSIGGSSPIPLTSDAYCVRGMGDLGTINAEFDWSADSKEIVFAHSPGAGLDDYHLDSSLAIVDVASGNTTDLEKCAAYESMPRFSPDGKWIAYLSDHSSHRYAINRQVALRSRATGERQLLAKTFNEGPFLGGANLLGWNKEGDHILFFEPKGTKFHIALVPADGSDVKELSTGSTFFKEPAISYDRTMLGFIAQTLSTPPEAYVATLETFKPSQVSHLNQSLLSYSQPATEIVSWKSTDGMEMEGLLTYPVNYSAGKQYPLLLVIHGGPMGFFDETYLGTPNPYPLACFAEEGYLIFRPNPRGSTGYGESFRTANYNDWGGMDFVDILSGVDSIIAKGIADKEKCGVMGWSYGGYMTAWTITQTNRFKAASMGAGLCNLVSMIGTTDLHRFMFDYLGAYPESRSLFEERSPLTHTLNVTTPCLIQHGTTDKRVPVAQAYEFYHALSRNEAKPRLVLYPGMEHRITDPKMQLDAMQRNLAWFQSHLMNK